MLLKPLWFLWLQSRKHFLRYYESFTTVSYRRGDASARQKVTGLLYGQHKLS